MASQLVWKVFNNAGEMIASTRYAEDAAVVVSNTNDGTVKRDGRIVWREGDQDAGRDGYAGESYDSAAGLMHHRAQANAKARYERIYAA